MADAFFLGGNPTAATNWSTGSVIAGNNADTATLDARMTSALTGVNQLTVTLARLDIYAQAFAIGSAASPWRVGASVFNVNLPPPDGSSNAGPAMIALDLGTNAAVGTVYGSRSSGTSSQEPVQLAMDNATSVLTVLGGRVGVARMTPAQTSTLGTVAASGSAVVALGRGATAGLVELDGNAIVHSFGAINTANVRGGRLIVDSTDELDSLVVYPAGVAQIVSRRAGNEISTITSNGGVLDLTPDVRPLQIGTINLNAGLLTVRVRTDASQLAYTTLNLNGGGIQFVRA